MKTFAKKARALSRSFALLGFVGLLLLALMTTLDVLLRWLFQAPLQGVNDISSVAMAVIIALCIPANLALKQNIKVEIFGALGGRRLHAALELLASVLTLVFITIMAWQFVPFALALHETGDRTWVLGWPVWPWWSFSALMLWFAVLIQVFVLFEDLYAFFSGDDSGGPEAPDEPLDNIAL